MRALKVESCIASLRNLSLSELNEVGARLVTVDPDVADQLEFVINSTFQDISQKIESEEYAV